MNNDSKYSSSQWINLEYAKDDNLTYKIYGIMYKR